ncbi:MAG: DUF4293 domain-containing protein [Bacteroidales bacterium]|nr:DUF4293 domain-containing protein [Bacteroidales bacterium]MCF8457610.1 DUF4293 domain-containing protein [Bacteroidales bacterium]
MIQRIQTVYLFICFLLTGSMFLVPIAEYLTSDDQVYEQNALSITSYSEAGETLSVDPFPVGVLAGAIAFIFLTSIFVFKNRKLQMRLVIFNMVLIVGLLGLVFFYSSMIKSELDAEVTYGLINISPIVALVLAYISFHRIRLDEALVKSYDRIR